MMVLKKLIVLIVLNVRYRYVEIMKRLIRLMYVIVTLITLLMMLLVNWLIVQTIMMDMIKFVQSQIIYVIILLVIYRNVYMMMIIVKVVVNYLIIHIRPSYRYVLLKNKIEIMVDLMLFIIYVKLHVIRILVIYSIVMIIMNLLVHIV